jgi:hypothetical protein
MGKGLPTAGFIKIFFHGSVDTNPPLALIRLPSWSWFENHRLLQIGGYHKRLQPAISSQFDEGPACDGLVSWTDTGLEATPATPEPAQEKDVSPMHL